MSDIDMRHTCWGHNINLMSNDENGTLRFAIWSTPRADVGDRIRWRVELGECVGEVIECELCRDPQDMAFVTVKVVERIVKAESA